VLLLVGLGNPGPEYAHNRHNVGFMAADGIAHRHGFERPRNRFKGLLSEGRLDGEPTLILKPMTYMNESGRAVAEAMRYRDLEPADVLVVHDEIDLLAGKLRMKTGGGTAGHNGLRSIAAHIGPEFRRMRIGVGRPMHKEDVLRWVLRDFAKADRAWLEPLLEAIAEAAPLLAGGQDSAFASKVALILRPPEMKPPASPLDKVGGGG
jgi:peptidyl-tRNA hydrolase, PTH1 family